MLFSGWNQTAVFNTFPKKLFVCTMDHKCQEQMYFMKPVMRSRRDNLNKQCLPHKTAGQYQWIEYYTHLPITEALVDLLVQGHPDE